MQMRALGSYILVEEFAETSFGRIYKALPLKGEPKISFLHLLNGEIGKDPQTATIIKTYFEKWKKIKDINSLNLLDWQEKDSDISYCFEYERGRLLSDLLSECRREGIPLAYDQAVYLASRIVEGIISIRTDDFFYGNFTTEQIFVTFEGEVRLLPGIFRDLHMTPVRHSTMMERFVRSYPADLKEGRAVKSRDQAYFIGLIFFEFLCRETFEIPGQDFDPKERLEQARSGIGMGEGVPENLMRILERSLLRDRDDAYKSIEEVKSDFDELVDSGEYSPSTFNTAFLIHTLYRDQDELEAARDEELLLMDRKPFEPKIEKKIARPVPSAEPETAPSTFGMDVEPEPEGRKRLFIGIGAIAGIIVIAILGWLIFGGGGNKEKELKAREEETQKLKALEEQNRLLKEQLGKLQTEAKQKEEQVAKAKTPEEKAQAQKALDEAKKKLVEAQKIAENAAKPAVKEPAPGAAAPQQPAASQPQQGSPEKTPEPEAKVETAPAAPAAEQPAEAPALKQGDFVDYVSLDIRPQQANKVEPVYSSLARQNKVEGRVYVKVDIDEDGNVTGAEVIKGPNPDYGLFEACRNAARKTKFSPAMKNNVRVKTSYTLNYSFQLQR